MYKDDYRLVLVGTVEWSLEASLDAVSAFWDVESFYNLPVPYELVNLKSIPKITLKYLSISIRFNREEGIQLQMRRV